jgi:hypothetical protein
MLPLDIIVPIILLALSFLLKAFIDRTTTVTQFLDATCELPSDIMFLGLSFLSATIIKNKQLDFLALFLLIGIILEIIAVILWRISVNKIAGGKSRSAILITGLNYVFSIAWLIYSVSTIH